METDSAASSPSTVTLTNGFTPEEALPATPQSPSHFLFTSESVGEGHPDKIADQVSDAILDACLAQDPMSKVACETAVMTGLVLVFGEISSHAQIDYNQIVRDTIKRIGYDDSSKGFDHKTCNVMISVDKQSKEIAHSLIQNGTDLDHIGAGDQVSQKLLII